MLIDVDTLYNDYYTKKPDPSLYAQTILFGTSGHRGTPLNSTFTEAHVRAIAQTAVDYRRMAGYNGPLFLGRDTHAVSTPAQRTVLEVLAANGVTVIWQANEEPTPTPVISRAILVYNRDHAGVQADGLIVTPSHNPPTDGGIKYNPPHGGAADTDVTAWMQKRANEYLRNDNRRVKFVPYEEAIQAPNVTAVDFKRDYIDDLESVIDFEAIRRANPRLGVDPLGGAAILYWKPIAEKYGLDITVVNDKIDPTFSFMTVDHDGKIRMDCSSPWSMRRLVAMKDKFDLAFANDPDSDRHGIVVPSVGLMNPNHYLSAAIRYLTANRPNWPAEAGIGKTLVSSAIIDRVVGESGRELIEVPVGFKWFVPGLYNSSLAFGGEESAGASFLRKDGTVWTTDKDGIILNLLAAEILAKTGKDPGILYQEIEKQFGSPVYRRIDQPIAAEKKKNFASLTPERISAKELAGEPITATLTRAPGNGAPIGGIKMASENGWFAARPSGTENIYKIYAESFLGEEHLQKILTEAQTIVNAALE